MRMTVFSFFLLAACATFPELDATIDHNAEQAKFPTLMTVHQLKSPVQPPRITEASSANLAARVGALRARAARLRGSIVDGATRTRMRNGVTPPAG